MTIESLILVIGGTFAGLVAGVYYAFHVSFVPALRGLPAAQHIRAMQLLNTRIENPVFFLTFFGAALLLPVAAFLYRDTAAFWWLVAASVAYIGGSVILTGAVHIPMNRELAALDAATLTDADAERFRTAYQGGASRWMSWHAVRTLVTAVSCVLAFIAALSL